MRATAWVGLAATGVVTLASLTGCKGTQREVIVFFAAGSAQSEHEAALRACTGAAPNTSPEPIEAGTHRVAPTSDVRFRIDKANDHDIAQLERCLSKQPGVIGVLDTMDTT